MRGTNAGPSSSQGAILMLLLTGNLKHNNLECAISLLLTDT
jgi:hypothetical protein